MVHCVYSTNVERPRDLKEAFNIVLAGLHDDSVSNAFFLQYTLSQVSIHQIVCF